MAHIDITGLPPAAVFAALFNYARIDQRGEKSTLEEISLLSAFHMLKGVGFKLPYQKEDGTIRYGYDGRLVPVDLRSTSFNPVLYNLYNGDGAAELIIECMLKREALPYRRLNRPITIDMTVVQPRLG